jgi:hypothetical protein
MRFPVDDPGETVDMDIDIRSAGEEAMKRVVLDGAFFIVASGRIIADCTVIKIYERREEP